MRVSLHWLTYIRTNVLTNVQTFKSLGQFIYSWYQYTFQFNTNIIKKISRLVKSRISTLRLNGRTALGPALAVSVGFLRKTPGSEIVLCTDGEPNLGIGSLPRDSGFYEKVRLYFFICSYHNQYTNKVFIYMFLSVFVILSRWALSLLIVCTISLFSPISNVVM